MTGGAVTFTNARLFDGTELVDHTVARFENGVLTGLNTGTKGEEIDLKGDILCPGYTDLQVNGGGGVMFNDDPSVATLRRIAEAHRSLGVTQLLPTLITDTPDITRRAISAAIDAVKAGVSGIAGLHLEGPHLSVARKGAHEAALIRPMEPDDLDQLLEAAQSLPVLKVTIAPENVTEAQVETLASAGVLISIGHSDADFETCQRYIAAGARCVTHLFNAMSQIGNRAPGLAGAALANGAVSAGLIADAVHVHAQVMRMAWTAKTGPGRLFLVSDAMAVAGTSDTSFTLNGRTILRRDGQLRLEDGTLAGADLDLTTAVSVLVHQVGVDLQDALAAATRLPSELCGLPPYGPKLGVTQLDDFVRIRADLSGIEPTLSPKATPSLASETAHDPA